jgi:Holliday junction resolvasome RuvABC endonuclease subunit
MNLPGSPSFCVMGIDQSLTGTGISVLKAGVSQDGNRTIEPVLKETIKCKSDGMQRLGEIVDRIIGIAVGPHVPHMICMEDVTRMASSASIIPLTELYAVIKFTLWRNKLPLRIQNQSQMKKFNFGQGNVSKDSNYMLKVFDVTKERFDDDNQADAYMHAKLGVEFIRFMKGWTTLEDYTVPQQEVFLADALKASGLSQGKFKKLSNEEKMRRVVETALA